MAQVAGALAGFDPRGQVLELAGGTGWWTRRLAETAEGLTVLDASPEALDLNRTRVARQDVRYLVDDVFDWSPDCAYDVVFFSFWLSHVPRGRFDAFWELVRSCLAPQGRVLLIDNRHDPTLGRPDPYVFNERDDVQRRHLNDGSEHRVVKVYYETPELAERLQLAGWQTHLSATRWFIYGAARPG